jgi:alanyl-tRNA synthetase
MTSPRPGTSAREVRQQFLEFFRQRGHTIVPSASVVPSDDPTLLFTNAGMNQFKDVFLGTGTRAYTRAVDTQKCIRVSGKHNDLEEVGLDTYHHTFFEMLGNWSFGDYFKREAIRWSWELLTGVWKLPKERLWATVFGGDPADGLPADLEAERIWREETDIDPTHVLRFGRKDNFWEMGETGPCGPCTEIHIDRGGPGSDPRDGLDRAIGVNAGNERFMELWNNVFMQFNRRDDGTLAALPACHVDTGMGFERVLSVLQGKRSNYDTDLFTPIFAALEDVLRTSTGIRYAGGDSRADVAFRVCADHIRAVAAAISDGALPSNTGRGYVLRRLIRRAARFGGQSLGWHNPFLYRLVPAVAEVLGPAFPEIAARAEHVARLVREEELAFQRTLGRGLLKFDELIHSVDPAHGRTLPGNTAYELYATYGFPQDLVEQMLREQDWTLDREGWKQAETVHRAASRGDGESFKQLLSAEQLEGLAATPATFHEAGDAAWRADTRVAFFAAGSGAKLVLERTPFYPESGGQVGDTGLVSARDGAWRLRVEDTQKLGGVVVHLGTLEGREPGAGDAVEALVDRERREHVRRNHTATHLLHKALRDVLGSHVTQQGSYVGPDRLRFDFSHPQGLGAEVLEELERRVNAAVLENGALTTTLEDLAAAKARGVMALFGEKYEERVRVVSVAGSTELCGGTHVRAAGDIGTFVIVSERALAAGVRRIEALTGHAALAWLQAQRRSLGEVARALKVAPEEAPARVEALQEQLKEARRKGAQSAKADAGAALEHLRASLSTHGGVACAAIDLPELDQAALRDLGDRAKGALRDFALVLVGRQDGKLPFLVLCDGQALARGLKAGELAGLLKQHLGGGGGGKPESAQGAGNDAAALPAALAALRARFEAVGGPAAAR